MIEWDTTEIPEPGRWGQPLAARLRVVDAHASPAMFRLARGACRVGAGDAADFVVKDPTVSRLHAEFEIVGNHIALRDLGSRNGTFLYGQKIERAVLSAGTRVRLGRVEVEIEPDAPPAPSPFAECAYGRLQGASSAMRRMFALLGRIEHSLATVLVSGESGSGKELVARAIHERSRVSGGPFVSINCGTLERNLAKSELFGHARGSFTGAIDHRAGAFELAHGGTLFLDEIGEMPLDVQPFLLRALELGVVVRLGESHERSVKARVIAATHRDLGGLVKQGRFREDLLHRLLVVKVTVPPLRERMEDVALLAQCFAAALDLPSLPVDVVQRLSASPLSGNVRELKNIVEAYSVLGEIPESSMERCAESALSLRHWIDVTKPYAEQKERLLDAFLAEYVEGLIDQTGGNQSEAARISGLARSYLNRLLGAKRRRRSDAPAR
jgi:two-component system nitrogen regulation response regulator GlnG